MFRETPQTAGHGFNRARRPIRGNGVRLGSGSGGCWLAAVSLLVCLGASLAAGRLSAAVPAAQRLVPENTLLFVRVADVPVTVATLQATSWARMLNDPQLRPIVSDVSSQLTAGLQRVERELGLTMSQLAAIPQGQFCFALVLPEGGRPVYVIVADVEQQQRAADKLLGRLEEQLVRDGFTPNIREIEGVNLVTYQRNERQVAFFQCEGSVVLAGDASLAEDMLLICRGQLKDVKTLADSEAFQQISRRSQGTKQEPPAAVVYFDPVRLLRANQSGNVAGELFWQMLPALGIDGLKGVGGGIVLATDEFDSLANIHLVMPQQRDGVLKALALTKGDCTPDVWVPGDVASYLTVHWNLLRTFDTLEYFVDLFRGEGTFFGGAQSNMADRLGLDLKEDMLEAFGGRLTSIRWVEPPFRENALTNLLALQATDRETAQRVMDKIATKLAGSVTPQTYRGVTYYQSAASNVEPAADALRRRSEPVLAVIGDDLVVSDSRKLLRRVIDTSLGGEALADDLEFKLVMSKIGRHLDEQQVGMVMFVRLQQSLGLFYESLRRSPQTPGAEESRANRRGLGARLREALQPTLQKHPLPPFERLEQYFAPAALGVVADEEGYHGMAFTLRRP